MLCYAMLCYWGMGAGKGRKTFSTTSGSSLESRLHCKPGSCQLKYDLSWATDQTLCFFTYHLKINKYRCAGISA